MAILGAAALGVLVVWFFFEVLPSAIFGEGYRRGGLGPGPQAPIRGKGSMYDVDDGSAQPELGAEEYARYAARRGGSGRRGWGQLKGVPAADDAFARTHAMIAHKGARSSMREYQEKARAMREQERAYHRQGNSAEEIRAGRAARQFEINYLDAQERADRAARSLDELGWPADYTREDAYGGIDDGGEGDW